MPIDFSRLEETISQDKLLNPREIFSVLPAKKKSYQYLRDVQSEVLKQWFERRNEKNIVLKMNTGSGKTIVGLLILKSCLNESKSPAVYISPDNYLKQQVHKEAKGIGLEVTDNIESARFRRGQSILITTIRKLINGKSVFGVGEEGKKIPIGSLIIDDAHACLAATESQFTLTLDANHDVYNQLFELFRDSLSSQSSAKVLEVEANDPSANMMVPYWSWIDKINQSSRILFESRESEELKFSWPLLKENLRLASCVFGGGEVEISLPCLPIEVIPSFFNPERKIFMSATLSDDSLLIKHFNIDSESITKAITPSSASDIGNRMIVVPQELNPDITDDELKSLYKKLSKKYNVVVIVPSYYRAQYWEDVADMELSAENLFDGVSNLKKGHVGLVILVNKYDGIDLPYDTCSILVIDGVPDVRRKIDKIEQYLLNGSGPILTQIIQKIEQGMGRGIRSTDDHCVVFLMGSVLISHLYVKDAISKFTPATKTQIELSEKVLEQVRGNGLEEIENAIYYCLNQDTSWLKVSKNALVHLQYDTRNTISQIDIKLRSAFEKAQKKDYSSSIDIMQEIVDQTTDTKVKGWLKQQLGNYMHFINPIEAQIIQKSALDDNGLVLSPTEGIDYKIIRSKNNMDQSNQCLTFLTKHFPDPNTLIYEILGIVSDLVFRPDSADKFENAFYCISHFLGFYGQRPEAEFKQGPDIIWATGNLNYLVIECKNGTLNQTISKRDCDQLSGSMNWFNRRYDNTCKSIPVLIHPSHIVDNNASPAPKMRVINKEKLELLKTNILKFIKGYAASEGHKRLSTIRHLLNHYSLTNDTFMSKYSVKPRILP